MLAGRMPGGLPHYGYGQIAHGPPPGYSHAAPPPMQYHPGYPPPGGYDPRTGYPPPSGYDPRTGAPVYGGVPPSNGHGAPPVYAQPAASPPPGHGHEQAPAVPGHAQPDTTPADFARQRPEAYTAFEQMAIHPAKDGGTDIRLSDGMCRDKHVADFLKCLKCWLWHHQGDPKVIGRPWRIQCLDLSRNGLSDASASQVVEELKRMDLRIERLRLAGNGLSDASASQVMEELKRMDLRIERLRLAGNGIEANALGKVTAYIWNCPDALLELDLSDNQVEADPDKGPTPGSDVISALLRCFYNHSSYPQIVTGQGGLAQVLPLMLLMGGNRVKEPARLLKYIEAKGGKKHVKILPSSDPYDHVGKEYLSVCLPNLLEQQAAQGDGGRERTRRKNRSRSGHGERRVTLKPAPEPVKGVEKSEKKAKKSKRSAPEPAKDDEPDHWSPGRSSSGDSRKRPGTPKPAEKKAKKSKRVERVAAPASPPARASSKSPGTGRSAGKASTANAKAGAAANLSDEEQRSLQEEVGIMLGSFGGLSKEDGSSDMLAELVVCMAVASKPNEEIRSDIEPFIGDKAAGVFIKWLSKHIQQRKRTA